MTTLGVIVGNRNFFPDHLCESGRKTVLEVLEREGIKAVIPPKEATNCGAVETLAEARLCAEHFKKFREEIDGVLVTLPNFGDERAVANTLRFSGLDVPVLLHAFGDTAGKMTIKDRRDSFCGKMSAANNLRQYGIKYSLTRLHTVDPTSDDFRADLRRFVSVCNVVNTLKGARVGVIGARPAAFNTVRFSEKLLERSGISVETLDLSEVLGWIGKMGDQDAAVKAKLEEIQGYTEVKGIPTQPVVKMAKLGVAIDEWMKRNELCATAIQCWTSMEEFYGVVPCMVMSMMSNRLLPSACETDIAGMVGMLALTRASGEPSAILDWNNNYGQDPNKGVVFHCSNLPKAFFGGNAHKMDYQEIIAGSVGKDNTFGTIVGRTIVGRVPPSPFTYCRVSTDDVNGKVRSYLGEGRFTDDPLETFGGYGVVEIPRLQVLLQHICDNGYEHHVAASLSQVADAIDEALSRYLGWDVYHHRA
jgi:L-fucose isomerase-like protein